MPYIDAMNDKIQLPPIFQTWFDQRGWQLRRHQREMLEAARAGEHTLLVAPTGAGKTLAGFIPTIAQCMTEPDNGLNTLYVSPLKALAVDVARNLTTPVTDMKLPIRIETRTGDTPSAKKARQRSKPPHILLTTPESLSLLISYEDAKQTLSQLKTIIIDEIHAFAPTKRGDLLALALTRLSSLNPNLRRVGLSATIADVPAYQGWLSPTAQIENVRVVHGDPGAPADIQILIPDNRIPWSGHAGRYALKHVYELIVTNTMTLIFTNTRATAERIFRDLWMLNNDNLSIGLHHGSLSVEHRRKIEAAMANGQLQAIVTTSSLDLGIDWGNVDMVVQMGAPKGAARLLQRIGRANHRLDEPSRAVLVPGNRFEYLETVAAVDAAKAGELDGDSFRPGALDVLAQHLMGLGCGGGFVADAAYDEITHAAAYASLSRQDFDDTLSFVVNGGYALQAYDRFKRLRVDSDGIYRVSHPKLIVQHRLNAGTIVEAAFLNVRLKSLKSLGKLEEWFAEQLSPGDTFGFAGQILEFLSINDANMFVRPAKKGEPKVPSFVGGRMPLSTHLANRVRQFLATPSEWTRFPPDVQEWLGLQRKYSVLPAQDELLVETFPRNGKFYMVAYCFEGRSAHQTLGLLLTRRMETLGLKPMGFVGTDYVVSVWSLKPVADPAAIFSETILSEEFMHWMAQSSIMRRSFRDVAVISGLTERQQPGLRKTGKQVLASTDLIYDVLRKYEPDHILLRASWDDARNKVTDIDRLARFLQRIAGKITHKMLQRVSPLSVPVMLEISRENVFGSAEDALLAEASALLHEATA